MQNKRCFFLLLLWKYIFVAAILKWLSRRNILCSGAVCCNPEAAVEHLEFNPRMFADARCNAEADQESILQLHEIMSSWSQWEWPWYDKFLHVHQWSLHGTVWGDKILPFSKHALWSFIANMCEAIKLTWASESRFLQIPSSEQCMMRYMGMPRLQPILSWMTVHPGITCLLMSLAA